MLFGLLGDTHDNLDRIRDAVRFFNHSDCDHVLFAGDLVSPIAIPPLRKLNCKLTGCFGDNEGNKPGIHAGISIVGTIGEAPISYLADDGTRFVLIHSLDQLRGHSDPFDIAVHSHTHKPSTRRDDHGRWFVNPGEACGWVFGKPTVALFDTNTSQPTIVDLRDTQDQ
ncbi:MAG: metallophosphoesterase family protein [Pirellulaceae bacterium]|nr:hypothetical protein [Planctomycetaceae bacterium]HIM30270.1 hypothetical protein [Planctomycetota bacterium]